MQNAAFWDRMAPKYAKDPISDQAAYETTLGRMRHYLQPDHHVVELGCGTGSTALALAPGVQSYLGTDVSSGMIDIARRKLQPDGPEKLKFEVAAAAELPPGPVDAVLALNLLHLLPDLPQVLRNIASALPKDGLLITKTALLKEGPWYLGVMIPVMQVFGKAPYVLRLSQSELLSAIEEAGFDEVETILQQGTAPRLFTVHRKR
ncbi:class I SAM-dependent methyltransferase [Cognatiyoonia sp. IB215446]|uniref:class I SAM-dependent methyltransferase n=1 Tax=Cognatiyoonia sp. IB215446 TaxID=3097355 RepID=UPI002A102D05|nr:class I SAM-dependent methyltransferase [Cognatiyoonia sp. IB215446]MDX8348186.1 class I SAM-dependent methyltransferase [Cognatiyoonia sp. IB215446]